MKLLCISNGHGEDGIAVRIFKALRQLPNAPEMAAMPIVGEGQAFQRAGIAIASPTQTLPSGGFIYMDSRQLAKDVQSGLIQLTLAQIKAAQAWAREGGAIFAVGDVVPLAIAHLSGAPYAFLGTAKSEYWLRNETGLLPGRPWFEGWSGSVYLPWERWLMSRFRCRAVFVRDELTASWLRRFGIPAHYGGNPMMDGLAADPEKLAELRADIQAPHPLTMVLLPGSRSPEAERNWQQILQAADSVAAVCQQDLLWLAAIDPKLDLAPFHESLLSAGWAALASSDSGYPTYRRDRAILRLAQNAYAECLEVAQGAIATAGTATEQLVGLGKPAFTFPGAGPQFTHTFAEVQARLLGESVILAASPEAVGAAVASLFSDAARLEAVRRNGLHRMGPPGGSDAIASRLAEAFS